MPTTVCPVRPNWPSTIGRTLNRFRLEPTAPAGLEAARAAHFVKRGPKLGDLMPQWEVAEDDCSRNPSVAEGWLQGYPCHIHTSFELDGQCVHIDRMWGQSGGPHTTAIEFDVFVDGQWLGLGGAWSAHALNLGIGPGIALLRNRIIVLVRQLKSWRTGSAQEILAEPDPIELYESQELKLTET